MAQLAPPATQRIVLRAEPAHQAYQILHIGYANGPMLFGLDKFFHLLANWTGYLPPTIARRLPVSADVFTRGVGIVEVIAGFGAAPKPGIGGYIVAFWLWAIVVNLVVGAGAYDIALRDLTMSFGALAIARLARQYA